MTGTSVWSRQNSRLWGERRIVSTLAILVGILVGAGIFTLLTGPTGSGDGWQAPFFPEFPSMVFVVIAVAVVYTTNRGTVPTFLMAIPPFAGATVQRASELTQLSIVERLLLLVFFLGAFVFLGWRIGIALADALIWVRGNVE